MQYRLYFVVPGRDKDNPKNHVLQPDGDRVFPSLEAIDGYLKEHWQEYWDIEVVALPFWKMEKPEPEPLRAEHLRM